MNIYECELCHNEFKRKTKDIKEELCPVCHKNGKIDECGIWVPTLKEKECQQKMK